ncbi:putative prostatic spermine-binding protein-like [Sesbania bispinosa]|nr:putative prostatic spermine-binding protein-like [Sesbania bispinosa]
MKSAEELKEHVEENEEDLGTEYLVRPLGTAEERKHLVILNQRRMVRRKMKVMMAKMIMRKVRFHQRERDPIKMIQMTMMEEKMMRGPLRDRFGSILCMRT